jgi:hypothetical protein
MMLLKHAKASGCGESSRNSRGECVRLFHRIVVILDRLAPNKGAFSLATTWASRLDLPLTGVIGNTFEREAACAAACSRLHIAFEMIRPKEHEIAGLQSLAGPTNLMVIGRALPAQQKKDLLHLAQQETGSGVLVCPDVHLCPQRILVLDQGRDDLARSLPIVTALHRVFDAKLVVLTVAHTEKEARLRQQSAQSRLTNSGLPAEFDAVIGSEVRGAVVGVARWRRCQLVVMSRHVSRPWWRWLRNSNPDWFLGLTQPLAFLSLPDVEPTSVSPIDAEVDKVSRLTRLAPRFMDTPIEAHPTLGDSRIP